MSERYTKRDAEAAFGRLARRLDKDCFDPFRVGAWTLDHNATYGGFVIAEIVNEHGGETRPFGDRRMSAREFVQSVDFALRAIEVKGASK